MTELLDLPFKVRLEIAKVLLRDNPTKRKEIVEWLVTYGVQQSDIVN